jgi:apolipoprotein D and lipocalin family protein
MKAHMGWISVLVVGALFSAGCPAPEPPATVSFVDVQRYAGLWYEIAKYPVFFENGLVGVTAEYGVRDDGSLSVTNRGYRNSFDGNLETVEGSATVQDPGTNARLKVQFDFFPANLFPADYWIIALDEDYQWAVVSNPMRTTLWILARTPDLDSAVYQAIVDDLEARGFDIDRLEPMPQQVP